MQVVLTLVLNPPKEMTEQELRNYLEDNCPVAVDNNFSVSSESWGITHT